MSAREFSSHCKNKHLFHFIYLISFRNSLITLSTPTLNTLFSRWWLFVCRSKKKITLCKLFFSKIPCEGMLHIHFFTRPLRNPATGKRFTSSFWFYLSFSSCFSFFYTSFTCNFFFGIYYFQSIQLAGHK